MDFLDSTSTPTVVDSHYRGSDQMLQVSSLSVGVMCEVWSPVCSRITDHPESIHKLLRQKFETQLEFEEQTQSGHSGLQVHKVVQ
jgi:hypothetical protein